MTSKKLGSYLQENRFCDQETVRRMVADQARLQEEGIYKPLGLIMVESGLVSKEGLHTALGLQRADILNRSELFGGLPQEVLLEIAAGAEDQVVAKEQTIFCQGDPGDTFCIIISGRIRVSRRSEDGANVILAELGEGDGFGEMALLTGEPRSATVTTILPSRLLVVSKNSFDQVVAATPELNRIFAKSLSDRLCHGNIDLARATASQEAMQRFASEYRSEPQIDLIGNSIRMAKLKKACAEAATNSEPLLIVGEPGTEKRAVAWAIHRKAGEEKPFLVIDAKSSTFLPRESGVAAIGPMQAELALDSALFGHARGSLPTARSKRLGVLQVGNGGTVLIDNIDSLPPAIQEKLVSFMESGSFLPLAGSKPVRSSVRLMATRSVEQAKSEEGGLQQPLADLLNRQVLTVPPLRKRKKDLAQLTAYLVARCSRQSGKEVAGVGEEAYREIMAYEWPGNMDELEVAIRRGVNLARTTEISPQELFVGFTPAVRGVSLNLLKFQPVKALFAAGAYPVAGQLVAGCFFLLIAVLGFWGSQQALSNPALPLTWGIWEPAILIGALFLGRLWCALCPVGALSSLISRFSPLSLKIPALIRNHGTMLGAVGLAAIFWAESASSMHDSPRATAWLLVVITSLAVLLAIPYKRRTWCRYICPLGKMIGLLSCCSITELRANYGICNNDCQSHDCYLGDSQGRPGCPMYEGPFSLNSNQDCILCGNCIKNCPHGSPLLNLRLPGQELRFFTAADRALPLLTLTLLATQLFRGLEMIGLLDIRAEVALLRWGGYGLVMAALFLGSALLVKGMAGLFFPDSKNRGFEAGRILVVGLLPLIAAFEVGYQLEMFLLRSGALLPALGGSMGRDWQNLAVVAAPWAIALLQLSVIVAGIGTSGLLLSHFIRERAAGAARKPGWRLHVLLLFFALLDLIFFFFPYPG